MYFDFIRKQAIHYPFTGLVPQMPLAARAEPGLDTQVLEPSPDAFLGSLYQEARMDAEWLELEFGR